MRGRLVEEVERITGGRAEVGSFHVVPFHMQVEIRNITVHGKEAPSDIPLAHADSLLAQLKVISLLRTEFGFNTLTLDHPIVHISIGPDGTTNIPGLKVQTPVPVGARVDQLFALSIDHLSVCNWRVALGRSQHTAGFFCPRHRPANGLCVSSRALRRPSHRSAKQMTNFSNFRPFSWMTSADFSLGSNFVDLSSLTWNSGRSSLKANGRVNDFLNPHFTGTYDAQIDVEEAAAIARSTDLRRGVAQFKGNGEWSFDAFTTSGALALRVLAWEGDQAAIKNASVSGDYSVTDQQLKLSKLQGKLLAGSFTGEAQVDNWLHNVPPGKGKRDDVAVVTAAKPAIKKNEKNERDRKLAAIESGSIRLRIRDVSVAEVANALDVRAHPLGRFHPVGLTDGTVETLWRGSPKDADVTFALAVEPLPHPAARELPLTAQLQGKYRAAADSLELTRFDLSTPASKVQASGTLASPSTLHVSVSTTNLEEWRPLVTALGGPTNLPFRVDGNAAFNGVIGGTFSGPTLAGTLVAEDFQFTVPATSRTPQQEVQWDSLAASIQFSKHELALRGGSLRRGETSADFDINVLLLKGQFTDTSPYTAHVNLHKVDVASTAALAGFDYPVSGTADVSLQIGGTRLHPQAQGHIHATNASAYKQAIEQFDADLRVATNETSLRNIHLTHESASVSGEAAYSPSTRSFRLDLSGKDFDLAAIPQIQLKPLLIEGRADARLQGTGTLDQPVITAGVHVRNLTLDHEVTGALDFTAVTKNGELELSGYSEFPHGTLKVDGKVETHGDYPAVITAKMDHLDLDALWRAYLGTQLTGHSSVAGSVTMEGPLRYPRLWKLKGTLPDLNVEVEYAKLHNQDPVNFTFEQQTIHIAPMRLVGEGTDVTGQGSIQFTKSREIDLVADGQADLRLIGGIDPNLTASGLMTVHMVVGGTLSDPLPQGTIQIKNGTATYSGLPSGLSDATGTLSFTRDRLHIENLSGRTGGGTLEFKGDASYFNRQLNFNVMAVGRDVRLRYPPGVSSTANAEVHWIGSPAASTVTGDIMVTKLAVTPGFDFGSYLERSRQAATITPANSPLYNVKLDLSVRTAPELQMKTAVARLSGDADLRLRGSAARPSVLGRADILEGDATFNGIKFRLERGDITFANPVAIEPQVNLQATTHVRNYDLDVTVTGTPDRLNVNYRSEPPLPKSDIIALLALGRTSEESEQLQQQSGQTLFNDEATALIINQAINATVSNRLQKLFGVSRIKIDPQGMTTETNPTARGPQVTIEQQFANNVTLTYSTNVSQSSQQIIQGEYYINRNLSVVGTRDQNGVVSFDVRIRRRKK